MTRTMDSADFEIVKRVLHDALGVLPADRVAFVTEACQAQPPHVETEILDLLSYADEADDFAEVPALLQIVGSQLPC